MKPIADIADIVEIQTWALGKPSTASALEEQLKSALDEEEAVDAEDVAQNVMDEFKARRKMLAGAYPFTTDGYKLELSHAAPESTTYLFCLGLSTLPAANIGSGQRSIQFETVVMNAAQSIFGGHGLRIGAPWRCPDVPNYAALLDKVIELIPTLGSKIKTKAPAGGDAGWDVLIVKNFCDDTIPRFIAFGNCATGRHNWEAKGLETQPTLFWTFFQGQHLSAFMTFFAVPFTMNEDARLRKLSPTCLTLDRFRICEHAPTTPMPETAEWLNEHRQEALEIALN